MTTARSPARLLLTHPEHPRTRDTDLLGLLTDTCPEMTDLARPTGEFAALLTSAQANDNNKHTQWVTTVRTADLPHPHSFRNGLELDRAAVNAGVTLPHHNGSAGGVNSQTRKILRQEDRTDPRRQRVPLQSPTDQHRGSNAIHSSDRATARSGT
ncbi:hypothetical protein [Streptomyces sp. NPDC001758]